jgi:hypothetical protein
VAAFVFSLAESNPAWLLMLSMPMLGALSAISSCVGTWPMHCAGALCFCTGSCNDGLVWLVNCMGACTCLAQTQQRPVKNQG